MPLRCLPLALLAAAVCSACGESDRPAAAPDAPAASAPAGVDWRACRIPGAAGPVAGRLFVVDGGAPAPGTEPGRETIRRVDVFVPGPVALLLTARDATAWHVRLAPDTQLQAVFASGEEPQRLTGQRLGNRRVEVSRAFGHDCGRYWLADGEAGLTDVTREVFGRPYDALYRMRTGLVVIGGPESSTPDSLGPR